MVVSVCINYRRSVTFTLATMKLTCRLNVIRIVTCDKIIVLYLLDCLQLQITVDLTGN